MEGTKRKCLRCNKEFTKEYRYNFLCSKCRGKNTKTREFPQNKTGVIKGPKGIAGT